MSIQTKPWVVVLPLLLLASSLAAVQPVTASADDGRTDVSLEVRSEALPEGAWERIVDDVAVVVADHPALFPEPTIVTGPGVPPAGTSQASPALPASLSLGIAAGPGDPGSAGTSTDLPGREHAWTARFGRVFLEAAARRLLEEAPTTPGISSEIGLEWHPEEGRIRTLLTFAGPLDIPNGRCWVDDVLAIDPVAGLAIASGEQGLETSPFAEGACGRFFSYLPDGGAGEQAISLLPVEVALAEGKTLRFVATEVIVGADEIVVGGRLEVR